jgi:uncharacterized membrane protein
MTMNTHSLKFIIGWAVVLVFRLIPYRIPNVEPMLATVMPFSKHYGPTGSFLFGFLGIVLYDALTSGWGIWTLITALAYGVLGLSAHAFFKNRPPSVGNFLRFGIIGTIAYDAITGLTIGPIFEHQPFMAALIGQIPFTLLHLLGTVVFSVCLSPLIYRWVLQKETFQIPAIIPSWRKTSL